MSRQQQLAPERKSPLGFNTVPTHDIVLVGYRAELGTRKCSNKASSPELRATNTNAFRQLSPEEKYKLDV